MRIYDTLPDLTAAEAARLWMKPEEVLGVAAMFGELDARRFFHNLATANYLPFRRSGDGKTSAKLYSLEAAVMARTMWEENDRGRTYAAASVAARAVADLLPVALAEFETLADFREAAPWKLILFDVPFGGLPAKARAIEPEAVTAAAFEQTDWWGCSAILPHQLIYRCIESYSEVWADALAKGLPRASAEVSP